MLLGVSTVKVLIYLLELLINIGTWGVCFEYLVGFIEVFICLLWLCMGGDGTIGYSLPKKKNRHRFFCVPHVFGMNVSVGALHVLFSFNLFIGEVTYNLVTPWE